jgi:hypothetical protein
MSDSFVRNKLEVNLVKIDGLVDKKGKCPAGGSFGWFATGEFD